MAGAFSLSTFSGTVELYNKITRSSIACHSRASGFRVTASQALMYLLNLKPPMQGQALQLRPLIAGPSGKVCA